VKVGVGVDSSRDHEFPGRLVDVLSRQHLEAGGDLGDVSVGCRAHVGRSLASDVYNHSASYQHDQILLARRSAPP